MSKLSKQKISLLGLILMAASAVTAAIIPNKRKPDVPRMNNGALLPSSVGMMVNTCIPHPTMQQCTYSAGILTATSMFGMTSPDIFTVTITPTSGNNGGVNTSQGA